MNRNASLDMLRGYALVCIMLNHMPRGALRQLTLTNFAIYDAAELFVFLAGWSIGIATRTRDGTPEPRWRSVVRMLARTVEVYRAQLTVMLLALAVSALPAAAAPALH